MALLGITVMLASPRSAMAASITWGDCDLATPEASAAAIDCGWLETGDRLAGEAVRLRVVRLRARPDRIDATPVVYVPGGPGSAPSPVSNFSDGLRQWA